MFEYEYIDPSLLNEDANKGSDKLVEGSAKFFIKSAITHDRNGIIKKTREGLPKFSVLHAIVDHKGNTGQIWKDISSKMQSTIYDLDSSVGINLYNKDGKFNPLDLKGCSGECIIKMSKGSQEYEPKMTVDKYLPCNNKSNQHASIEAEDDDIPF